MSERMHAAVLDEPPMGFDPDEVVNRAVRRQRNRRTVVGAATAVAIMATASTLVFGGHVGDLKTVPGTQPTESSDSPPPTEPAGTCVVEGEQSEVNSQFGNAAGRALVDHGPGVAFGPKDSLGGKTDEGCVQSIFYAYPTHSAPDQRIMIGFYHATTSLDLTDPIPGSVLVQETPQQDGSVLRFYDSLTGGTAINQVTHHRTDGLIVWARATPRELATVEQLTAIATDPDIAF